MRKFQVALFSLLLCLAFAAQAQIKLDDAVPIDPNVKIGKLSNGLTYYIRKNNKPERKVEMRLAVNVGSILEREDQQGLAHFMEHMAFNGTKDFQKNELVSYLQSIGVEFGADLNAYTGFDETVYLLSIPTEKKELVDKGLLILADWASEVTLDEAEINKERGVVLEELRLGKGANQRMRDRYFPKLFQGSQYANRLPIGKQEVLEKFSKKALVDFYETWYRPDLMAVVVVGDVDVAEMEAKIRTQFSGIKAKRKATERPSFPIPDTKGTIVAVETDREATGTSAQLLFKKPAEKIKTQNDLRRGLVKSFFNGMLNARLDEIRQSPNPPFIGAGGGFSSFLRDKSVYSMVGSTNPNGLKSTITTLLTENRRVKEFGFTKAEFDRQKERYLSSLDNRYRERDKTESARLAAQYVSHFLTNDPIEGVDFDYQFGKSVVPTITLEEVNALAKDTITEDNRVIIVSGIAKDDFQYPTEAEILGLLKDSETAKLTPYTETTTGEPLVGDLPTTAGIVAEKTDAKFGITYWTLSNGVKIVLKPTDFKADEIVMSAFSPGGMSLVDDAKARSGIYFSQLVNESGLRKFSKVELNKMLSGKKASANIGVGGLFETVNGSSTPKDFETMLQLAYLKFTDVNFDKAVFDSFIAKQKMFLPTITANPQIYFLNEVNKIMTQNHPRAFSPFDAENLDKARLEDIQAIYKERFADASDFTFIFVGNFENEKIKPQILKYLGNLPSVKRTETWKDLGIKPPDGTLETIIKKGVDDKSLVQIIYTGETAYDRNEGRDLAALGEFLTIKLVEVLREEKSGVYGAGASGNVTKIPTGRYTFSISFPCGPDNVESLTKAAMAEVEKIRNGQIDEKDIDKIKEARRVKFRESLKENSYWVSEINRNLTQDAEIYSPEELEARINAISKENLQKIAQKYLKPEQKLQFVLMPEVAKSK